MQISEKGEFSISLYQDAPPPDDLLAMGIVKLRKAFPDTSEEFFSLLSERVDATEMTAQQFADAVNHVIDNFPYRKLNIADIISFDKKIKLYTFDECYEVAKKIPNPDFVSRKIDGDIFYIKKADLVRNGLKIPKDVPTRQIREDECGFNFK